MVGESRSTAPNTPISQWIGITRALIPVTVLMPLVPARLSQKMLLKSSGLLKSGRAARQGGLQLVAVRTGRKTGRSRLTIAGDRRGRGVVLHDRVVEEAHIGGIVEGNTAAFVRGDVVDDHVVVHIHREVARHQEAQTAAIIVSQVGLDQVVVDIHRAGALRAVGCAIVGGRVGRQFAGDHDAGAFIVGMVEVDAVVVDPAVGAQAEVADRAAVLRREVAAQIVAGDFVAIRAVEQADRAGQVRAAVGEDAVVGDAHVVVVVDRWDQMLGVPMRMAP